MALRKGQFGLFFLISVGFIATLYVAELWASARLWDQTRAALRKAHTQRLLSAVECASPSGLCLTSAPIIMPACDRPEYLSRVLASLRNSTAAAHMVLIVSLDCDHDVDTLRLLSTAVPPHTVVLRHRKRWFGIPALFWTSEYFTSQNVRFVLETAFEELCAPSAIVLESDIEVSRDFYEYFQWALSEGFEKLGEKLFTVGGYNYGGKVTDNLYEMRVTKFEVWGWAMSAFVWPYVRAEFTRTNNWDMNMNKIRTRHGLLSLLPTVGRTRHIGSKGINFEEGGSDRLLRVHLNNRPADYSANRMRPV